MTSIADTIDRTAPQARHNYGHIVAGVEDALTEREYTLSDQITAAVVREFRVSEDDVRTRLEGIGMAVRPAPEPEPVVVPEPAVADEPAKVESKGKKGKLKARVAALEELAKRHLGVNA